MRRLLISSLSLLLLCCQRHREEDRPGVPQTDAPVARTGALTMPSFEAMRLVLLGSGTPTPDPARSKPAVAIIAEGHPYIVDFGAGLVGRAIEGNALGIEALDIRRLTRGFATHLHSDHTSGLSDLWLTPAAVGRMNPLEIYGPPGIAEMASNIFAAYREDLAVRTHGRPMDSLPPGYRMEAKEIEPGVVYEDNRVKVTAFPVSHEAWTHAYGYRFDAKNRSIVISGDTAPTDTVAAACNGCDVLVHEVYCEAGFRMGPPGFQQYHGAAHTSAVQLARIAESARPKLLVLYHLLFFGCTEDQLLKEVTDNYSGDVALGHDLDIF